MTTRELARVALIAAAYALITVALPAVSYGPLFQLRVSEALTVLPYLSASAVPGLFIGCVVANVFGGLGLLDIVFGSLATLLGAVLTRRMPTPALAPLPPIVVNAVIVGWYLAGIAGVPVYMTMGYVALGQSLACYGLGYPLLLMLRKNEGLVDLLGGTCR